MPPLSYQASISPPGETEWGDWIDVVTFQVPDWARLALSGVRQTDPKIVTAEDHNGIRIRYRAI